MDKHTPELWTADGEQVLARDGGSDYVVAECYGPTGRANAVRIAAAVNTVQSIPTDALEAGVIRELLEVLDDIVPRLEWDGWDDMYRTHICPVCGAYRNKYKHYPNCKMAKTVRLLQQIRGDADA